MLFMELIILLYQRQIRQPLLTKWLQNLICILHKLMLVNINNLSHWILHTSLLHL